MANGQNGLYDKDWAFLMQLVYRINELSDVASFQSTCLEQLKVLIPCVKSVFFLAERKEGRAVMHSPVAVNSDSIQFDESRYTAKCFNTTYREYFFAPWSSAFRHSDNPGERLLQPDSPLYQEIYAPQGLYYGLRIVLIYNDHLLGDIGMFRSRDDADFSDRELLIAKQIKDILALRLYQLLYGVRSPKASAAPAPSQPESPLTQRELEVLELIRHGYTDADICSTLFISLSTLRKHIHSLYQKTGARNRVQLLKFTESL